MVLIFFLVVFDRCLCLDTEIIQIASNWELKHLLKINNKFGLKLKKASLDGVSFCLFRLYHFLLFTLYYNCRFFIFAYCQLIPLNSLLLKYVLNLQSISALSVLLVSVNFYILDQHLTGNSKLRLYFFFLNSFTTIQNPHIM